MLFHFSAYTMNRSLVGGTGTTSFAGIVGTALLHSILSYYRDIFVRFGVST